MALKALRIGKAGQRVFTLPVDFATQKAAFLGRTGSGKTYAAMKTAEQMLKQSGEGITTMGLSHSFDGIYASVLMDADLATARVLMRILAGGGLSALGITYVAFRDRDEKSSEERAEPKEDRDD